MEPIGWTLKTLRECLQEEFPGEWGTDSTSGSANATVLRSTDIDDEGHVNLTTGVSRVIPLGKLVAKRLRQGDLLLETSGGGPNKPVGRVALFRGDGIGDYLCSNFFRTLRPLQAEVDPLFLRWRLQFLYGRPDIQRFQQQTTGIINLKTQDYFGFVLQLPNLIEQRAIAEILDTIDKAILGIEQLIVKLERMKQGVLRDLLARGIDKNGELRDAELHPEQFKDSLLGRIPGEWQVRRLGDVILSAVDGPFGSNLKTAHYVESPGVRVVRLQNIGSDEFINDDRAYVAVSHAKRLQKHDVRAGDLLVASMGDDQHPIARACLYPEYLAPGIVKADCFRLRADPSAALNGFISLVLSCPWTRSELQSLAQGVTRDRVNLGNLMEFRLALPRVDEQVAALMRVLSLKLRTAAERDALVKLRSVKLGLMEDLLTGRVRVPTLIEGGAA